MFPFFTPQVTQKNLTKLGVLSSYDVSRPVAKPPTKVINTVAEISAVLKDTKTYKAYESIMFEKTAAKFSALANVCVFWILPLSDRD